MSENLVSVNWVLLCTFLVCLMQVGFLWLETGLIRQKSSVNVAIKNMADFFVSSAVFWAVGFGIMFGTSANGFWGHDAFLFPASQAEMSTQVFFFFQLAFCGTAVTIVSGAVAERMSFAGYMTAAIICAGLIYPVYGHWAWNGLLSGDAQGWLEKLGFIDFAGSTVVHSIGGWVALAAVLVVGPRLGRFGRRKDILAPHNLALSIAGAFMLWIGWFGFNGGSVLAFDESVPGILLNTLMAASTGGLAVMIMSWALVGKPNVQDTINGLLAGLVAITANCHIVSLENALLIGAIGGLISLGARLWLEKARIDDAVSAIPVHLAAGIWGTLAVALFGNIEAFGGASRLEQLQVQAIGVGAAGAYAFGLSFVLLWVANRFGLLRVSRREEVIGLNISEHGSSSPLQVLLNEMGQHARSGDFSKPVHVERDGEAGPVAAEYNRVLRRVQKAENDTGFALEELRKAKVQAEAANIAKSQFLANVSHELRTPLNSVLGFSDILAGREPDKPLTQEEQEFIAQIKQSGEHLLSLIVEVLDFTQIESNKFELNESALNVTELVLDICQSYASRIQSAGLTLDLDMQRALPSLLADKKAIRQIIVNLLSNAVNHSGRGQTIRVSTYLTSDNRINLIVSDNGKGIPEDQLTAIFTPFHQVLENNSMHKPDGLGLGLPIAQALTELHDGELFIRSAANNGTEVSIRFPAARTVKNQDEMRQTA